VRAVVDPHGGRGVVIGTAAAAGLIGRLMDDGRNAAGGQAHRGGQARKSGADDVDGARHQMKA
jgi:hypothetical protein